MPANGQGEVESNVPILQRLWIVLDSLKTYPGLVQLNAKQGSNVLFCSIRTLLAWRRGCAYFLFNSNQVALKLNFLQLVKVFLLLRFRTY